MEDNLSFEISLSVEKAVEEYLDILIRFRLEYFKEYPYLYYGTSSCEKEYLSAYITNQKGAVAVAKYKDEVVGILTGAPLQAFPEMANNIQSMFSDAKANLDGYYYYGDVIVSPQYRSHGLATRLFSEFDAAIQQWGFKSACLLTIVREDNHPLKPKNYKVINSLWKHLGFLRTHVMIKIHWPTIQENGEIKDDVNALEFWSKETTSQENIHIPDEIK
jgi:GNAT superfamily N-acetyltransferase